MLWTCYDPLHCVKIIVRRMDCNQEERKSAYLVENTWEVFPYHGKTHAQATTVLKTARLSTNKNVVSLS